MIDSTLNVHTHDLEYRPYKIGNTYYLPGHLANSDEPIAQSAHENVKQVATFIQDVLGRHGIDNNGARYISTVKCTKNNANQEWLNARWVPKNNKVVYDQVIYGQRFVDDTLISYAESLEIVAHEIFHGITAHTAKLKSRGLPGALNESYSDILAVIVLNWNQTNIAHWNWEIGRPYGEARNPLRSLREPSKYGQPEHMDNYYHLSPGEEPHKRNDNGWIHQNCGIHNKAAYNLYKYKKQRSVYF